MTLELYFADFRAHPLRRSLCLIHTCIRTTTPTPTVSVRDAAGTLGLRLLKSTEPPRLVCAACGFVLYLDPKVAVGTIIRSEAGGLVLVRRAIEPGYGKWVFPGGYVDRGESILDAAVREAREECGLDVELEGLVNIYSYRGASLVVIVYAARAIGGSLAVDDEGLEAAEFTDETIPWSELAFRSTGDALRDYMAGLLHPVAR